MSLQIVTPDFAPRNHQVVHEAHAFADLIQTGELPVETAIIIALVDGKIDLAFIGANVTVAEGIGMLELAKAKLIEGAWR